MTYPECKDSCPIALGVREKGPGLEETLAITAIVFAVAAIVIGGSAYDGIKKAWYAIKNKPYSPPM